MMKKISDLHWPDILQDPSGMRSCKPRQSGRTMVIDKGMGLGAFEDLLQTSGEHIDIIKLGFGTACLYPLPALIRKIRLAEAFGIEIMPGGTFLEIAESRQEALHFLKTVADIGFTSIEISDGTIDIGRARRNELIRCGLDLGLKVYTEFGKKQWGSRIDAEELAETIQIDLACGASMVTVEGRESGAGVGVYDERGNCREEQIGKVLRYVEDCGKIMWETPRKEQQVYFIKRLGPQANLGNIAPEDVLSVEALRRGLRSDTFVPA
jgi:phosphosulfolactate synthase